MKLDITFRHLTPSDAIKTYVQDQLDRLDRYPLKNMEAHIVLVSEAHIQKAEVEVKAKDFHAMGTGEKSDLYQSIADAVEKVEKTVRRHHDKIHSH